MPVHIRKFMCVQVKEKVEKRNEKMNSSQNDPNRHDISEMGEISPSQIQNMSKGNSNQNISSKNPPKTSNVDISKLRSKFSK